jgi:hypothetical protein
MNDHLSESFDKQMEQSELVENSEYLAVNKSCSIRIDASQK